jgi:hypothetical protein
MVYNTTASMQLDAEQAEGQSLNLETSEHIRQKLILKNKNKLLAKQELSMLQQNRIAMMKPRKVLGYEDMKRMQEKMEELRIQAETGQKKVHLAPKRRVDQD